MSPLVREIYLSFFIDSIDLSNIQVRFRYKTNEKATLDLVSQEALSKYIFIKHAHGKFMSLEDGLRLNLPYIVRRITDEKILAKYDALIQYSNIGQWSYA